MARYEKLIKIMLALIIAMSTHLTLRSDRFQLANVRQLAIILMLSPQWRNWQTRSVQVAVWLSMCRFDSCLRQQISPSLTSVGEGLFLPAAKIGRFLRARLIIRLSAAVFAAYSSSAPRNQRRNG